MTSRSASRHQQLRGHNRRLREQISHLLAPTSTKCSLCHLRATSHLKCKCNSSSQERPLLDPLRVIKELLVLQPKGTW